MGRPQFATPGTQGSGRVVATTNRPEVTTVNADQTANVAAGNAQTTEIYAPSGAIYEVVQMKLRADAIGAATSGSHDLTVKSNDYIKTHLGESAYSGNVIYTNGRWKVADKFQDPDGTNPELLCRSLEESLMATENSPITVRYRNNTDADQTANRDLRFTVKESTY